jgi:hypothetical protein
MVGKASFTPDEWNEILQSVMTAGIAVSAAEPSGLFGMLKESMASAHALLEAKTTSTDELIKAVVADFETSEGRTSARAGLKSLFAGSNPADIKTKAIDALRQASALLDAKAPADAVAFKTWSRHIAQSVAEATKEGGFLGFGGVAVSETEKATLAEISAVLNLPAGA